MISREPTVTRPALDSACLLPIRQQQKRQGDDFFLIHWNCENKRHGPVPERLRKQSWPIWDHPFQALTPTMYLYFVSPGIMYLYYMPCICLFVGG